MHPVNSDINPFPGLVDLASARLGGKAILASDEFFAAKDNLLKPEPPVFIPDKYTDRGKWMDGWESRRKRSTGNDWCIIKLGCAGIIHGVDIDTSHFLGNNPAYASLDAAALSRDPSVRLLSAHRIAWTEILTRTPLKPGSHNLAAITDERRWTHIRLNIFPDGGVARLRVFGMVSPDWSSLSTLKRIDLASVVNGGLTVAASDMFFSPMNNLILPGASTSMADGWETRRRRGPGHDWVIVKLGRSGTLSSVEIDTSHFKGNHPDRCSLDACFEPDRPVDALSAHEVTWNEVLPISRLDANAMHVYEDELRARGPFTHVRLNIYPDGGVSRLRIWGKVESG